MALTPPQLRINGDGYRLTIIGDTGSGKTVAALYHLSRQDFSIPWVVYDWKLDGSLNEIARAKHVDTEFTPAKRDRGIFIVHPRRRDFSAVEQQLDRLYEREDVGIYFDEGRMTEDSELTEDLITQGRSKGIPMIVLSQRPVDLTRYLWGNSEYVQYFPFGDDRDMDTAAKFMSGLKDKPALLPRFWSYYYDKFSRALHTLKPVPEAKESLERIDSKLRRRKILL